jgi:hypothetical protein
MDNRLEGAAVEMGLRTARPLPSTAMVGYGFHTAKPGARRSMAAGGEGSALGHQVVDRRRSQPGSARSSIDDAANISY